MSVDRTRRFSLPGIHELNKDQDEALALPVEGQHLIVGGPGTGKSVVALLRARRLNEAKRTYGTLVYNQLLHHSNRHLFGSDKPDLRFDSHMVDVTELFRASEASFIATPLAQ